MPDPERLQRITNELAEAASAIEEGRRVRLPVIQRADAAALIQVMHAQLDDAISRRDAQLGARLACKVSCNSCCMAPVLLSEGEAIAIAEWLRDPAHAEARARFEAAYPHWRDALGELVAHKDEPRTPEQTHAWCLQMLQRQTMCAFNHEGACTIYAVRPGVCRKTHALDTNAHCGSDDGKVLNHQHPETEATYENQRPFRRALHMALRPNGRLDLLPAAVHRLLGGAAAGRNEPCPCGSGKKYKKCCGAT